jgi:hypothetical protein
MRAAILLPYNAANFQINFLRVLTVISGEKIDLKNLVLLLPKMSRPSTESKKATILTLEPMSYQVIQQALSTLKEEHEKTIELNKKLQFYRTTLEKAFLTGKTDQLIFEGLYKGGQITVTTLTGGKIPVNVRYTDNVKDIQEKIYKTQGIPVLNQRIIFGGRRLKPHRSIYSYKIPVGGQLHLVMDMSPVQHPWCPSDPKEIADDQYYIEEAVRKLIEREQFKVTYGY